MINYKGKTYYTPRQGVRKFGVTLSTFYYWYREGRLAPCLLNVVGFCKHVGMEPEDLGAKIFMEENFLKKKVRDLKGRK